MSPKAEDEICFSHKLTNASKRSELTKHSELLDRSRSKSFQTSFSDSPDRTRSALFPNTPRIMLDADEMRARVRESLIKPDQYNVFDRYHKVGVFSTIAQDSCFEKVTLFVIALNALWIAIDCDMNNAALLTQADPLFQIMEYFFVVYFASEWMVRFMAFQKKRDCCRDAWFCFDSVLVLMMVLESWVMSAVMLLSGASSGGGMGDASILRMARLLRLSRMARMVRLLRAAPELLILIKGIAAATRSVIFTLLLLAILLYIFAIALRQLTEGTPVGEEHFNSILDAMQTLLIDGTLMDSLGPLVRSLGAESPILAVFFWVFVLLSSCTVMNMLIGVLCEVVNGVAEVEKETAKIEFIKDKMRTLFTALDTSGEGLLSKEEFMGIMKDRTSVLLLDQVGVDCMFLIDQCDTIFGEDSDELKTLDFEELMRIVLGLRGNNTATYKHIQELQRYLLEAIHETKDMLTELKDSREGGTRTEHLPGNGLSRQRRFALPHNDSPMVATKALRSRSVGAQGLARLRCCSFF